MSVTELSYLVDTMSGIFAIFAIGAMIAAIFLGAGKLILKDFFNCDYKNDIEKCECEDRAERIYKKFKKPAIFVIGVCIAIMIFAPSSRTIDLYLGEKVVKEFKNTPLAKKVAENIVNDFK